VHGINGVTIATEKFEAYTLPGSDQFPVEEIQVRGETLLFGTHKLINSFWN
jgi:hypothetical protein